MSELITEQQIDDAMEVAYLKAGHSAYFGNGFQAGVDFALEKTKADDLLKMVKLLVERLEENDLGNLYAVKRAKQLIQQATTIK